MQIRQRGDGLRENWNFKGPVINSPWEGGKTSGRGDQNSAHLDGVEMKNKERFKRRTMEFF